MREIKFLVFYFIIGMLFSSCNKQNGGEWTVNNIDRDTTFKAIAPGDVYGLELKINGEVDDSIQIQHLKFGGKINSNLVLDEYNNEVAVLYKSLNAKKGNLTIKYKILN